MAPIVCQGFPIASAEAKNLLDRARLNSYREEDHRRFALGQRVGGQVADDPTNSIAVLDKRQRGRAQCHV